MELRRRLRDLRGDKEKLLRKWVLGFASVDPVGLT